MHISNASSIFSFYSQQHANKCEENPTYFSLSRAYAEELSFLKYVGFASFAIVIWDHIDTFPDEVRFFKIFTSITRYY